MRFRGIGCGLLVRFRAITAPRGCVYDTIFSRRPGSDFSEIQANIAISPRQCWRFFTRTTPGHPPNLGQT